MITRLRNFMNDIYTNFATKNKLYPYLRKIEILKKIRQLTKKIPKKNALHGDQIQKEIFKIIGREIKPSSIIETGTFLGYSTELFAKIFPNLEIYTCEINKEFYLKAKKNLKKFLENKVLGERPLFYLDAHSYDKWPLKKEIEIISKKLKSAIIIIDDFKVPEDNRFSFDAYDEGECSIEYIKPFMNPKQKYNLIYPNYGRKEAFKKNILYSEFRGYVVIFQNIENLFEKLKNNDFIKKYFKAGVIKQND